MDGTRRAVARRHRTFVTTAAVLLITSVFGLATTAYLVDQERARTETNFRLARSAVDEMLTRLGAVDLVDIPGAEGVRRAMLEKARDFYLVFLNGQNGRRPSVRQGAAQALVRVGEVQELLGSYQDADASLKEAVSMLRPFATGSGGSALDYRRDLAAHATIRASSPRDWRGTTRPKPRSARPSASETRSRFHPKPRTKTVPPPRKV